MSKENSSTNRGSHSGSMSQQSADELKGLSERSKYVFDLVNSWIENNDNKVSVSCAVLTGAFGVVTFLSERLIKSDASTATNSCWAYTHSLSFYSSLIAMGIAIVLFCFAIMPKLNSNGTSSNKKYPLFFRDIASLSIDEYKKKVLKSTETDFINELILETHINSGICLRKMRLYKAGVIFSLIAIGLAILSFVSHFLMYR